MICRQCGARVFKVTNTYKREIRWQGKVKTIIRRRRICKRCGLPFFTVEHPESEDEIGFPEDIPQQPSTSFSPKKNAPPENPFLHGG